VREQFTQKERDNETGLDYFGARYYASAQGRFTSADSYGGSFVNPQTLNLYTYVRNNPLKYVDPTGHQDENPMKKGKKGNNDDAEEFLNTEDTPEIVQINSAPALGAPPPPPVLRPNRITQMSFQFNNFMMRQTIRFASGGPIIMAAEALLPKDWVDTWHSPGVQIPLMMSVVGSPLSLEAGAEEVTADGRRDGCIA
jgi:RHS repeat-associated protein